MAVELLWTPGRGSISSKADQRLSGADQLLSEHSSELSCGSVVVVDAMQ